MNYTIHFSKILILLLIFTNITLADGDSSRKFLVVFNGFTSDTGYPQDYYFYYEGQPFNFNYDTWVGSPLTDETLADYDIVYEFTTGSQQRYDNRSAIKKWLLAAGSRHYFLSGDNLLNFEENNIVAIYQPGSFEYDILGISKAYKNLGYIDATPENLIISPIENSEIGNYYYTEYTINRNEFLYYYYVPNSIPDGLECLANAQADFKSKGKEEIEHDISIKNYLATGNQIVFVGFDPIGLVDENNYGLTYDYRTIPLIASLTFPFVVSSPEENNPQPESYSLSQNYPNPFNPTTVIEYSLPEVRIQNTVDSRQNPASSIQHQVSVTLKVYDILGREVATLVNQRQKPGTYKLDFDASGLSSRIYFYSLRAGEFLSTKKLVLLK